jgi:hypothetical protein
MLTFAPMFLKDNDNVCTNVLPVCGRKKMRKGGWKPGLNLTLNPLFLLKKPTLLSLRHNYKLFIRKILTQV